MAKKKYYNGGGMISQGGKYANLPDSVKMTDYPEYPCLGEEGYNDTITGIDKQIRKGFPTGSRGKGK